MWTLETLIWMPMFVLLMVVGVVLLYLCHQEQTHDRLTRGSYYDAEGYWVFRGFVAVSMFLVIAGTALGMFPYKAEYHQWQTKDGTISEISKRLVGDGDGMQEKFVVRFDGSDQLYGCLDTRCALLEPGDYLKLACKKQFEYGATDGWDCKFRESREAA